MCQVYNILCQHERLYSVVLSKDTSHESGASKDLDFFALPVLHPNTVLGAFQHVFNARAAQPINSLTCLRSVCACYSMRAQLTA